MSIVYIVPNIPYLDNIFGKYKFSRCIWEFPEQIFSDHNSFVQVLKKIKCDWLPFASKVQWCGEGSWGRKEMDGGEDGFLIWSRCWGVLFLYLMLHITLTLVAVVKVSSSSSFLILSSWIILSSLSLLPFHFTSLPNPRENTWEHLL